MFKTKHSLDSSDTEDKGRTDGCAKFASTLGTEEFLDRL